MLLDNYTIADLTKILPSKEITYKKVPKPDSLTVNEDSYKFDAMEEYKARLNGSIGFAETLSEKVAEAKVAAEIARKSHAENVTANMIGTLSDEKLGASRGKAEILQKIYEEKRYAQQEATTQYQSQLDKGAVAVKFKNEAAPYLKSVLTEKEVQMAAARDAYMQAIQDFFLEAKRVAACRTEIDELRRSFNSTKYGSDQVMPVDQLTFTERSLIDRGSVKYDFPFQLSKDEMTLINHAKRGVV